MLLAERYANHLIPAGGIASLASELGTSRQHVWELARHGGYIVVVKGPGKAGAAQRIRDALQARYPKRLAPRGSWQALALELGVTRQHVRQVAMSEGFRVATRSDGHRREQA